MNKNFNFEDYLNSLNFLYHVVIDINDPFLISTLEQAIEKSVLHINSNLSLSDNTISCLQEFRVLKEFRKFSYQDKHTIINMLEKLD